MKLAVLLVCLAATSIAGCATPQQYVYNCTPFTIRFDGRQVATRTFEARSDALTDSSDAIYPDGSIHKSLRVGSSQIDSFGQSNAWISPANVCRQFKSQVVVVVLG